MRVAEAKMNKRWSLHSLLNRPQHIGPVRPEDGREPTASQPPSRPPQARHAWLPGPHQGVAALPGHRDVCGQCPGRGVWIVHHRPAELPGSVLGAEDSEILSWGSKVR